MKMIDFPKAILSLLIQLSDKQTVTQYFKTVFRYIINNIDDVSADDLTKIVKESLSESEGDFVMTLAEKLRKEGFEKGIQQGLIEAIELDVSLMKNHHLPTRGPTDPSWRRPY